MTKAEQASLVAWRFLMRLIGIIDEQSSGLPQTRCKSMIGIPRSIATVVTTSLMGDNAVTSTGPAAP